MARGNQPMECVESNAPEFHLGKASVCIKKFTVAVNVQQVSPPKRCINNVLPIELLQRILRLYKKSLPSKELKIDFKNVLPREKRERRLAALNVCRLWRSILLQLPQDWTYISVAFNFDEETGDYSLGDHAGYQLARVRERIQWAKHKPIDFHLSVSGEKDMMNAAQLEIRKIFLETQATFKSLTEETSSLRILYYILPHLEPNQLAQLTQIHIKEPFPLYEFNPIWRSRIAFPKLKILRFDCQTHEPLRVVAHFDCPNLVELYIYYKGVVFFRHFVTCLSFFPQLKHFATNTALLWRDTDANDMKALPSITDLVLTRQLLLVDNRLMGSMIRAFPNVVTLTLKYTKDFTDLLNSSANTSFMEKIKEFGVIKGGTRINQSRVPKSSDEIWKKAFRSMPSLSRLKIGYNWTQKSGPTFQRWICETSEPASCITSEEVSTILKVLNTPVGMEEWYLKKLETIHLEVQLDPFSLMVLASFLKTRYTSSREANPRQCTDCKVTLLGCTISPSLVFFPEKQINNIHNLSYPEFIDCHFIGEKSIPTLRLEKRGQFYIFSTAA